jgi:hypothetical protein
MDREAAVIRAEMSETRAQLDHKIALLEQRAREFSPKRYARDHMPEYFIDRLIGGFLTLIGARLAWTQLRAHRNHRAHVRAALASYGRW